MPKSYAQFNNEDIVELGIDLKIGSFLNGFPPVEPSELLVKTLAANEGFALNTEKAKSEFIIAPILAEVARNNRDHISLFSGHSLDVDKSRGLKGFCDFIFSRVAASAFVREPIFCIVEAKNDNFEKGTAQCLAEMFAAQIFNERQRKPIQTIFGCVTTGISWQFLKLEGTAAWQESRTFSMNDLPRLLGALQSVVA